MIMRTTLTLDDDVAAKPRSEMRRSGRSFREVVNDMLRRGMAGAGPAAALEPFRVTPRDLGELRSGLSLDNIGELIDQVEGSLHQ
jgi:hypothetical protein